MKKSEFDFYSGVLVSLQVIRGFDKPTIANEIVRSCGGIAKLNEVANKGETECDKETIAWLVENGCYG